VLVVVPNAQVAGKDAAAAQRLRQAVCARFFDGDRIARMFYLDDRGMLVPDWTPDAAATGLLFYGMIDQADAEFAPAFDALFERLAVRTDVGGYARYEGDSYFRATVPGPATPGNPWFICTLWRARYLIARAQTTGDLEQALPLLEWAQSHALPSGVLAEQVDPDSGVPLSVSPLTWSHAEFITAFLAYLDKFSGLSLCRTCHRPTYMREHRRLFEEHLDSAHFETAD